MNVEFFKKLYTIIKKPFVSPLLLYNKEYIRRGDCDV